MKETTFSVAIRAKGKPSKKGEIPLFLRYTVARQQYWKSLGLNIHPNLWDATNEKVSDDHDEAFQLNNKLTFQKRVLEIAASKAQDKEDWQQVQALFARWLAMETDAYQNELEDKSPRERKVRQARETKETVETYKNFIASTQAFVDANDDEQAKAVAHFRQLLDEYPATFIKSSKLVRQQITSWKNTLLKFGEETGFTLTFDNMNKAFYKAYGDWLLRDSFDGWFGANVKKLKTFLNKCVADGIQVNPAYRSFEVLSEVKEIIYLTPKELNLICAYQPQETWEQKYIDLCVFGNLTGLRVSDIQNSKFWVEDEMLVGRNTKNKTSYFIPLATDERIEQILNKYEMKLNLVSEVKYNKYIKLILKKIFERHGVNQHTIHIVKYKWRQPFYFEFQKHELISNHSSRRGFVTNMYNVHKYSVEEIKAMLGSTSNEILKYLKVEKANVKEKAEAKARERVAQAIKTKSA
ncbi:hypothetical protein [Hymenobacter cavernae]|uniref:Arm DNA-binding domain-containing protein n=1 Tax=Hymenobacter cavernae TaxID=2044852 RepID=A0ABQ1UTV5_9BACT|nr:hypothetical protein [Hymenobacter cavernae]GGF26423.1 hypothetical protein GCM10011383_42440 [Hymenobacter cavernae]